MAHAVLERTRTVETCQNQSGTGGEGEEHCGTHGESDVRRTHTPSLTCGHIQRREAFQELITLTHSNHPSLKSYAAGYIHVFFNDFPDLEEDAINAVYDLCEDHDSKVGRGDLAGLAATDSSLSRFAWMDTTQ